MSFPSGHTGSSFAAASFLALYLNAKTKAFADYHTSFWKGCCVLAPFFGALFISTGMIIDCNHHTHDVIISMFIGIACGVFGYRAHFHSLFDYRDNHIPLPYHANTESFKPADDTTAGSEPNPPKTEKSSYDPTTVVPERHLVVRWPFGVDERRGSRDMSPKPPGSNPGPTTTAEEPADNLSSENGERGLDGNSSMDAMVSTRNPTSTESVTDHMSPDRDGASSFHRSYRTADMASIRDRELIGSGTGSEVAEMV